MAPVTGLFVLAELRGAAAERIREVQERYDPKLARTNMPHVTLIGSSGAGPIPQATPVEELRRAIEPIAATTAPMRLTFGAPIRFMQTDIISLPLDPHGPLRALHERIKSSGLTFARSRFAFTPHATLNYYKTLAPDALRALLAIRVTDPALIDSMTVYRTLDPLPSKKLFEVTLNGA